ncbi:MAG: hypothetical protein ACREVV_05655 [Steroidobacteraceae bacterium]
MIGRSSVTSRRNLLLGAGALAGASALPSLIRTALAQTPGGKSLSSTLAEVKAVGIKPVSAAFVSSANGAGVLGPWGEVVVARSGSTVVPAIIRSADKLAVADMTGRQARVQIGIGSADAITLTSDGVAFGSSAKPEAWNAGVADKLIKTIASNRQKARSLMQIRAAFATSFPVYMAMSKSGTDKRIAAVQQKTASELANTHCSATTVTDYVTTTVTDVTQIWKSAEKQYQECFDHETSGAAGLGCSLLPAGAARNLCAAGVCTAKGFTDIVVGVIDVVHTVTEAVVRQIVTCVTGVIRGAFPNVFTLVDHALPGLEKPGTTPPAFTVKDLQAALKFLTDAVGVLGPFAKCLLSAKWSIESAGTPIPMGDGNLAIPYGIRVCMSADCARGLTIQGVGGELVTSWTAALTLLAALSPEFAALVAPLGVTVPAALAAAVAALAAIGTAAVAAAALILAFIILALIYGTALVGELSAADALGAFADGEVCIVHPTFALAMIKALTLGTVPAELVPPIVVG